MVIPNIESARLTREITVKDDTTGIITYAHKTFMTKDGIEFDILTDWMTMDKTKISVIDLDTGRIIIDHHEQAITFNGDSIFKDVPKEHRMHGQYLNYFKNFKFDPENEDKTRRLHKIIFLEKEDNLEKKTQNDSKTLKDYSMEH